MLCHNSQQGHSIVIATYRLNRPRGLEADSVKCFYPFLERDGRSSMTKPLFLPVASFYPLSSPYFCQLLVPLNWELPVASPSPPPRRWWPVPTSATGSLLTASSPTTSSPSTSTTPTGQVIRAPYPTWKLSYFVMLWHLLWLEINVKKYIKKENILEIFDW